MPSNSRPPHRTVLILTYISLALSVLITVFSVFALNLAGLILSVATLVYHIVILSLQSGCCCHQRRTPAHHQPSSSSFVGLTNGGIVVVFLLAVFWLLPEFTALRWYSYRFPWADPVFFGLTTVELAIVWTIAVLSILLRCDPPGAEATQYQPA